MFDLDGTLIDSVPTIALALNRALGASLSVEQVRGMVGDGADTLVLRAQQALGRPQDLNKLGDFVRAYRALGAEGTATLPGADETLRTLAQAGWRLGLVTNKMGSHTLPILQALGWEALFDVVIAGDTLPTRKPSPEPILAALRALETAPEHAVMVGDSANDLLSARGAGVRVALLAEGYSEVPARELGADRVIERLEEVLGWVDVR